MAVVELGVVIMSIAGGSIYKAYEVDKTVLVNNEYLLQIVIGVLQYLHEIKLEE